MRNGTVTESCSSDGVRSGPLYGALAVVQLQAADANGNVLGTQAVGTIDINIRSSADQAIVMQAPDSLYADGGDHRSHFTIQLKDASGNPLPDGGLVVVQGDLCAARDFKFNCFASAGGKISGGATNGNGRPVFTVKNGGVSGDYSDAAVTVGTAGINTAAIQVRTADASGIAVSNYAIGMGTVTLVGAAASEVRASPTSVPYVFPTAPLVQVVAHHLHDTRANLVPDGADLIMTAAFCGSRDFNFNCIPSSGGTMGGNSITNGNGENVYTLSLGEASATYSILNSQPPSAGQVNTANIQLRMANTGGIAIDNYVVAVAPVQVLGPNNAVGSAQPASVLADGGIHLSTVTFAPVLDAFGNPLPDGSTIIAAAFYCAARDRNFNCVPSPGGQILDGTPSPTDSRSKLFPVQHVTLSAP